MEYTIFEMEYTIFKKLVDEYKQQNSKQQNSNVYDAFLEPTDFREWDQVDVLKEELSKLRQHNNFLRKAQFYTATVGRQLSTDEIDALHVAANHAILNFVELVLQYSCEGGLK